MEISKFLLFCLLLLGFGYLFKLVFYYLIRAIVICFIFRHIFPGRKKEEIPVEVVESFDSNLDIAIFLAFLSFDVAGLDQFEDDEEGRSNISSPSIFSSIFSGSSGEVDEEDLDDEVSPPFTPVLGFLGFATWDDEEDLDDEVSPPPTPTFGFSGTTGLDEDSEVEDVPSARGRKRKKPEEEEDEFVGPPTKIEFLWEMTF